MTAPVKRTTTGSRPSWPIPILVFPAIAAFSMYISRNVVFVLGLGHAISSQCDVDSPEYQTWGSICVGVIAFIAPVEGLLGSLSFPYMTYANIIYTPLYLMILVEASRLRRPLILSLPLITGILLLVFTSGTIFPLYCLAFVLTGAASAQNSNKEIPEFAISRKNAEGITFGFVIGYVIPTIGLVAYQDMPSFFIFIGFHLWMSMFQMIWCVARPDTRQVDSKIVQGLYAVTFVVTSVTHIYAVVSRIHDLRVLGGFFLPPMSALEPTPILSPTWDLDLFQWDAVLSLVAAVIMTMWFAKDAKEQYRLFMWHVATTITVGPGAGVCGALLWREICLTKKVPRSLTAVRPGTLKVM